MRIAVIDYGAGNLRNVCKSLRYVGGDTEIVLTDDVGTIERADKVVLPGVGAFADCLQGLHRRELFEPVLDFAHSGRPFLGICVGMQLLFDVGEEMGEWPGLGLIPGRVTKFAFEGANAQLKIPHIGWNEVHPRQPAHPILKDVTADGYAYFVHSFHAQLADENNLIATTDYGYDFPAVVAKENVWGIQFHPEKSQDMGLQMLKNFIAYQTTPGAENSGWSVLQMRQTT